MVKILIGNIFESNAQTIVNTVNCVGVMGKGIAKDFKSKYPDMYKEYVDLCNQGKVKPGQPYYYNDLFGNSIINFPTKDHWRSPSKLSYIVNGLKWFVDNYKELDITSIAFPPLGCGNGGLNWELVGPLMYHWLKDLPIDIEIYAPFGTKTYQLTPEYLEENLIHNPKEVLGAKSLSFNNNWMIILEAIKQLNARRYGYHVGRTVMQKICYILTDCGIDTGFKFTKGMYGPYCADVENMIAIFSNANLITEKRSGKMIEMQVTNNFNFEERNFSSKDIMAMNKTIDLFARIKNTAQAELISTIIFAERYLSYNNEYVSENDIYNYIIEWKPKWKIAKANTLPDTIRELALLEWISPILSEDLEVSNKELQ